MGGDKSEAVKVLVRVRPFNKRERQGRADDEYPMSIIYMHPDKPRVDVLGEDGGVLDSYEYGVTFWSIPEAQKQICTKPFADQEDVFQVMGVPAVDAALEGYHCCIFAYGQTGSGKTYTMLGSPSDPGVAPRLVDLLFNRIENTKKRGWKYDVSLSFMEIYNEKVKDLLVEMSATKKEKRKSTAAAAARASGPPSPKGEYQALKVRQNKLIGVHVDGLRRLGKDTGHETAESVKKVMRFGMEHRATAETKMNATSSRSHAIFQLCITAKNATKGVTTYAHINIVDLAGSERITASGAQGSTLVEATRINLSLTTLRRVIDALIHNAQNKNKQLPPYRDSMLTYILSESLGGNSNTMMLATISPSEMNREDTLNTLRYAMKAKEIVNVVRKNEQKEQANVGHFAAEINALRSQLMTEDPETAEYIEMKEELQRKEDEQAKHIEDAAKAREKMEEQRAQMEEGHRKKIELEREVASMANVEVEQKRVAEEHKLAEDKMEEIAMLHRERSIRKHEAERALQHEAEARAELVDLKEEHIVQSAELLQEVRMLNKKKFALAFSKAFGMKKDQGRSAAMQEDIRELDEKIAHSSGVLDQVEMELAKEYSDEAYMKRDTERLGRECDAKEKNTTVRDKQYLADVMRGENDDLASENNRLIERISDLRVDLVGLERSKAMQVNRAQTRVSESKRRLEQSKITNIRLKDQRVYARQERSEVTGELFGTTHNKMKAASDYEERVERKRQTLEAIADLKRRNEALQLHFDTHLGELEAEQRRLKGLQCQHKPLSDEMHFSNMVLQLGYGRVAASGGRVTRPPGFVSAGSVSPRRQADFAVPIKGRGDASSLGGSSPRGSSPRGPSASYSPRGGSVGRW
eukprot:TRINITY_DN2617_c0_g1_i1.p1 TRINITY_DN2617_c0_g1~~TRINITY_DN2617_c0_g1_i1.p1  ORF type:complete len:867 (+),score=380.81 TRINITY_DN2617_c0_g1_i1:180-2780(+)